MGVFLIFTVFFGQAFSLLFSRPVHRSFRLASFSPLFSSFNIRFREQTIRAPEGNACTAGYKFINNLFKAFKGHNIDCIRDKTTAVEKNTQILSAIKIIAAAINLDTLFGVQRFNFHAVNGWHLWKNRIRGKVWQTANIKVANNQFLHFCLGNPNFGWASISSGLLAPGENFSYLKNMYGSLEKLFPYKLSS